MSLAAGRNMRLAPRSALFHFILKMEVVAPLDEPDAVCMGVSAVLGDWVSLVVWGCRVALGHRRICPIVPLFSPLGAG